MNLNKDMENYYFIQRKSDQAYPLIRITKRDDLVNTTLINLEFNGTIPRTPVMSDFLSGPEIFITNKIVNIIKNFNPKGVKIINTELTTPKGDLIEDYFCLITENIIEALDKEKSDFERPRRSYFIKKLILDRKILNEIPLEKRLVFMLRESLHTVFHEKLAKTIMEVNPTGMKFINIETGGKSLG